MNEEWPVTSPSSNNCITSAGSTSVKSKRGVKWRTTAKEDIAAPIAEDLTIQDNDSPEQQQSKGKKARRGRVAPRNYEELPDSDVDVEVEESKSESESESRGDYEDHRKGADVEEEKVVVTKKISGHSSRPQDAMYTNYMGGDWRSFGAIDYWSLVSIILVRFGNVKMLVESDVCIHSNYKSE